MAEERAGVLILHGSHSPSVANERFQAHPELLDACVRLLPARISMDIRIALPEDAPALVEFFRKLYGETEYLLFEPDEYATTVDQQRQLMTARAEQKGGVMFICEHAGQVVGAAIGMRSNFRRTRHALFLVLGVLRQWHRKGVGYRLMTEMISWARSEGMRRLELVVDVRNVAAIELYKKLGLEIEGTRRDSRRLGERFVDEYTMSLLLA